MNDFEKRLAAEFQDKEYRESYAESFANEYLATQIQILRKQAGLTQAELGTRIGSNQGRVSVYEDPDYGNWSLDTLRRLAGEFGLWLSFRFEPYGNLIHEASQFTPASLARKGFDDDIEIRRLLASDEPADPGARAQRLIEQWAQSTQPNDLQLIDWLQGITLPSFRAQEATAAEHLLSSVPPNAELLRNKLAAGVARLLTADPETLNPVLRSRNAFVENLFSLAAAFGPRTDLQDALDHVYSRAHAAFERNGSTGLGYSGEAGLLAAMLRNQVDDRWSQPVWLHYYIEGWVSPEDFTCAAHPFLPGDRNTGFRGLLELPSTDQNLFWGRIADALRAFDLRLRASRPHHDALVELTSAISVVFDWRAEPQAAQELLRSLLNRLNGSEFTVAAVAGEIENHRWVPAVCSVTSPIEKREFLEMIRRGLEFYRSWDPANLPAARNESIMKSLTWILKQAA